MKLELFPFQEVALKELRAKTAEALGAYYRTKSPQVISFTAPTGAGKTIILSSLIENIYFGDDVFPEQSDAIFVWLSDSPELNEQSKQKIETKSDRIQIGQCITIENEAFDQETLDDGYIYFLNTQKLGSSSNLTKYSDGRQFTIWDTLRNTSREKSDRLYFIIDEAHRGAKNKDIATATTIMQKFIKGSPNNNLEAMPLVIGMSATSERFNNLVRDTSSTIQKVIVSIDDVRSSGLLKEKIIITYPDELSSNKDMAVLQAATDEWQRKWDHWHQYCTEQHYSHVYPIFLIQVKNKKGNQISETDLDECLRQIENRSGLVFKEGEVVHSFGDTTGSIEMNGLTVPYKEPSGINDDRKLKIVFFKEGLSTGWDCPRAETMMSFRTANDATYVAQLLGRMVRTPKQMRIQVDETLNDVYLFLPHFDRETVDDIVDAFRSTEGDTVPAEVAGEKLGVPTYEIWTVRKPSGGGSNQVNPGQFELPLGGGEGLIEKSPQGNGLILKPKQPSDSRKSPLPPLNPTPNEKKNADNKETTENKKIEEAQNQGQVVLDTEIDREEITRFINESGLLTYHVRKVQINNYLISLFKLVRLLVQSNLDVNIKDQILDQIVAIVHKYIERLKSEGLYESLVEDLMQFRLSTRVLDVFGQILEEEDLGNLFSTTDVDIDRQFRKAEAKLGNEGIGQRYGQKYYDIDNPNEFKIHIILFAVDSNNINQLHQFAKHSYHDLNDKYRRYIAKLPEEFQLQYDKIASNSDKVSQHNFKLPETINVESKKGLKGYDDHLLVSNKTGLAYFDLNGWEAAVLDEERKREYFVCWLRNPSRKPWSLQIPYEFDNEIKPMYPDLIIIRKDPILDYVIDVIEPHGEYLADNVGKAKGLAEYARKNPGLGRIELVRMTKDASGKNRFKRLDMAKNAIRDKVSKINRNEELTTIFETDGEIY